MLIRNTAAAVRPIQVVIRVGLCRGDDEHICTGRFSNHIGNAFGAACGGKVDDQRLARRIGGFRFLRKGNSGEGKHQGQYKGDQLLHQGTLLPVFAFGRFLHPMAT